jgi:predicted DNA-binding protein
MDTRKRGNTSEMQVTSIRLEPELKERLRRISGEQGYQTLIREVLWQFMEQQMGTDDVQLYSAEDKRLPQRGNCFTPPSHASLLSMLDIRAAFKALAQLSEGIAQQEERCAITGQVIRSQQFIYQASIIFAKNDN